jgi:hypothetical protein
LVLTPVALVVEVTHQHITYIMEQQTQVAAEVALVVEKVLVLLDPVLADQASSLLDIGHKHGTFCRIRC